ncbi:MarR family winged helix-turn-helix transcriptional regulator [Peptostreptococcus porci]|uniref:MarR family winged helix-turn-helix transcriptional regulator n=1 Tax=Peptostreptococcus porci TaxID=2652282 RepID=UPI002A843E3F|nr:MarR family winged helix-turn-helix transcriptional regulator [Peptostreptococcus porci]MDY4561868.1 MarR family winged helix-turn-helix transcriptional regulator [Peptostreptococcus porci]MDY5436539.1 MarR family winged helix-turn-helix transcriptional regulator [Peptostreptococcus porci]
MIELKLIIGLNRTVNKINRKTSFLCKQNGLTLSQFAVLEALYHKGDMSVGSVKDSILSTDGTIPVVVGNLVKNGFITKRKDSNDKRSNILSLTEKGRNIIKKVYPMNEKLIVEQFEILEDYEKEELLRLLKKIGS